MKRQIERLNIGDTHHFDGMMVQRVANNRFRVTKPEVDVWIGGKNYSYRLAVAKVIEQVAGVPLPEPCARCGQPRVADSYCRPCFNRIHAEGKRKRR